MFCVDEGERQCGFVDVEQEQEDKFGAVQGWCIVMFNSKHAELQQWVQDCQVVFVMWVRTSTGRSCRRRRMRWLNARQLS